MVTEPPHFAFGTDLVAADGRPATLADHLWMWTDAGDAVAVPLAGRSVHGVLVATPHRPASADPGLTDVEVVTADGTVVAATAVVEPDPDPAPPPPGTLDAIIRAARRLGLPVEWREYLAAWGRAGRRVPDAASTAGAPSSLAELLTVPGVVEETALRSTFGFMAIHGGELEAMTDVVARQAADAAGASYYAVVHPPEVDVHLASTAYAPDESPALAAFVDHVDVVVSIHGYGRVGHWRSILLGGRNRPLAEHVGAHLAGTLDGYDVVVDLDAIPIELRGLHRRNPVNAPARTGVQMELPPRVRGLSPLSPPRGADGLSPPTRSLVDALAAAARSWS